MSDLNLESCSDTFLWFMSQAEVNVKIKKAYCPPKIVEGNPCLEYIKYIIFPWFNEFRVERSAENGGDKLVVQYLASLFIFQHKNEWAALEINPYAYAYTREVWNSFNSLFSFNKPFIFIIFHYHTISELHGINVLSFHSGLLKILRSLFHTMRVGSCILVIWSLLFQEL